MSKTDIRWQQRFSNYAKALSKFEEAVNYTERHFLDENNLEGRKHLGSILNDILKQGIIQSFEYTYELAWNVMRDYAEFQGNPDIPGSRTAIREALQMGLITEGKVWMDMVESRIRTTHTYNEEIANEIFEKILEDYHNAFKAFQDKMETLRNID